MHKQLYERLKSRPIAILLMTFVLLGGCIFHVELPRSGKVIDGETNEPLRDVGVVLRANSQCFGILCPCFLYGRGSETVAVEETLTDQRGRYKFPLTFHLLPFLCLYDDTSIHFIKPAYYEKAGSDRSGPTKLYKMTHYLDYLWYKRRYFPSLDFQKKSTYYQDAIDKIKHAQLMPAGEKGVFLSFPNRKFTTIYSSPFGAAILLYDQVAMEWLNVDCRGKIVRLGTQDLPEWRFFSFEQTGGYAIFATNNVIFFAYPTQGEIKYINPVKGDISGLSGIVDDFFTIEDEGTFLFRYKNRQPFKCYRGEDLPESREDDSVKFSTFKYIGGTLTHGRYLVTKTPKSWHVYSFGASDGKTPFLEVGTFSVDREITALAAWGSGLYLAFKNEGIRKFELVSGGKFSLKENVVVLKNSKDSKYGEILSLKVAQGENDFAIYAVTGQDKIYRFSEDGIPDYQLKLTMQ